MRRATITLYQDSEHNHPKGLVTHRKGSVCWKSDKYYWKPSESNKDEVMTRFLTTCHDQMEIIINHYEKLGVFGYIELLVWKWYDEQWEPYYIEARYDLKEHAYSELKQFTPPDIIIEPCGDE